ncbi:MAG TPA: UDP-N-acetylglucosamine 2-epimerase (non-hydrolyzing) [Acidiferrobacter sp.]|nr:UDP-N-acetylglucosamine 2-epimerase (non-hydrolyzing) [Acidiferrobacter sp.]
MYEPIIKHYSCISANKGDEVNIKLLFILGTRPEVIKLAPLILEAKKHDVFDVKVCTTGQHKQMFYQVADFFGLGVDYDLELMTPGQTLFDLTGDIVKKIAPVLRKEAPDITIVQGDTTTSFAGALASFYAKIPVAHVEAGLRSRDKYSPFPEEMNRVLVSRIADYHFAPSTTSKDNLYEEGIRKNVFVVGNTSIDALLLGLNVIGNSGVAAYSDFFSFLDFSKKIILVTGHRRENFGDGFENICSALKEIVEKNSDAQIVYPVHLNPNVREPVNRILGNQKGVFLIEPLEYPYLIWLMSKCYLVLTDSGGIQEEAAFMGKPVIVMRDTTERVEGIEAGVSVLVGAERPNIVNKALELIKNEDVYAQMSKPVVIYGDGRSSRRILDVLAGARTGQPRLTTAKQTVGLG